MRKLNKQINLYEKKTVMKSSMQAPKIRGRGKN